jgi:two-component system chemotaxis sensor kinase CheA
MDELLELFVVEGKELVQQASDDLLALEHLEWDLARVDSAFRAVHTLKGSVALFDFGSIGTALHAAEDLLGALREGRVADRRAALDALLACMNTTDVWIDAIAVTEHPPDNAVAQAQDLVAVLNKAMRGEGGLLPATRAPASGVRATGASAAQQARPDWLAALLAREHLRLSLAQAGGATLTAIRYIPGSDCFLLGDDPLALIRSVPELIGLHVEANEPWDLEEFDPFRCNLMIEVLSAASAESVSRVFRFVTDQVKIAEVRLPLDERFEDQASPDGTSQGSDTSQNGRSRSGAQRVLRVDLRRIDALADVVGELFVAKNRLGHLAAEAAASVPDLARALSASQADIARLIGDMHRAVMDVRMTSLDQAFRRLPRAAREIAAGLGKEIRLDIKGAGIEADKTIVDGLFEPLLHVVRNAADHGVETPLVREAKGKPREGHIIVSAGRDGDRIVITVQDDGAGIDPAEVRRAAAARGLLDEASLRQLDDADVLDLVFRPGFSTTSSVTVVSGRGVGMDAVRAALHAMGGRVGITARPGAGTSVRFVVPQAVAITTVVIVTLDDDRFGVPIEVVAETVRIPRSRVVPVQGGNAFVLRNRTIPLLRLSDILARPAAQSAVDVKVLVVIVGGERIGIEVDGFGARMDVVLRPMSGLLAGLPGIQGTALLGDGNLLLVLDVAILIK